MPRPENTTVQKTGACPDAILPNDGKSGMSRRAFLSAAVLAASALLGATGCSSEGSDASAEPTAGTVETDPPVINTNTDDTPVPTTLPSWVDPQVAQILLAETDDPEVAKIVRDAEALGQADQKLAVKLLKLAANDPAARYYVAHFREHYPGEPAGVVTEADLGVGGIPLLMQWDQRWGYTEFLEGPLGTKGCCPTCLSMIYSGMTRKTDLSPYDVGQMVVKSGMGDSENGTWGEFVGYFCQQVGLVCEDVPAINQAADYLSGENILVCNLGPGTFTEVGHYVLVVGYVGEYVRVRDPYTASVNDSTWPLHAITDECESIYAVRRA